MYVIYSKESCPFCVKAIDAISECGFEYEKCDIEVDPAAKQYFRDNMFKTVPQVFLDDQYIGGYEDLADHLLEVLS